MTAIPTVRPLPEDPRLVYRHTVDEYHRMIADGSVREGAPFELLDGQIVLKNRAAGEEDPMTVGPLHVVAVDRLNTLNPRLKRLGCHMRTQAPLTLPPFDEPEPDGAIVRGSREDFTRRHPAAGDVLCVIEVADASLPRDRGYKQRIYADSGIPQYVIVNLRDRTIEVYTQPLKGRGRYGRVETLANKQSVALPAGRGKMVTVTADWLLT